MNFIALEASKLVLFARKQSKRSAKIGVFQERGSKKYHQLILGNHHFSGERREEEIRKQELYHTRVGRGNIDQQETIQYIQTTNGKGGRAGKGSKEIIHFAATTSLTPREKEWECKDRVREIWANPHRVFGLGTTRIREEKSGNWKFARVKCPRKQRDS